MQSDDSVSADDTPSERRSWLGVTSRISDLCPYVYEDNVVAIYFSQPGRTVLTMAYTFLSVAILELAFAEVGCDMQEGCDGRVHGLRPSSLLTTVATIGGLGTALFLPFAGAVVDFTDRRRSFGRGSALLLLLSAGLQAFVTAETWFALLIVYAIIAPAMFYAQSMCMLAYTSDVSKGDETKLQVIVTVAKLGDTTSALVFLLTVVAVAMTFSLGALDTAIFAQLIALGVSACFLSLSWWLFRAAPARRKLMAGQSIWLAGLLQVFYTFSSLVENDPEVAKVLVATSFLEGAQAAFTIVAVTYLTSQIGVPASDIGQFYLLTLVCAIVGTLFHRLILRYAGTKGSLLGAVIWWICFLFILAFTLRSPEQRDVAIYYAIPAGLALGWLLPALNGMYGAVQPPGRETELWGIYFFAGALLTWLPPLAFTALNEGTGDLQAGVLSLCLFFVVGGTLIGWVNFEKAYVNRSKAVAAATPLPTPDSPDGSLPLTDRQGVSKTDEADEQTLRI